MNSSLKSSNDNLKIAVSVGIGIAIFSTQIYANDIGPDEPSSNGKRPNIGEIINNGDYSDGWDKLQDNWSNGPSSNIKGNKFINERELIKNQPSSGWQLVTISDNSYIINSTVDSVQVTVGSVFQDDDSSAAVNLRIKGGIDGQKGYLQLVNTAEAYDTIVEYMGSMSLNNHAKSYSTTIKGGGLLIVNSDGYALTNIVDGGELQVGVGSDGAIVEDNFVINGGKQIIYDGTAINSHIGAESYQMTSGLAKDTTIYTGGYQVVYAGDPDKTAAENTTVYAGGTQRIQSGNANNSHIHGEQIITNDDGEWEDGEWILGSGSWGSNANATNTTVFHGGIQTVGNYGHAYDTLIDGGTQIVKAYGHIHDSTVKNSGSSTIEFGGYSTGDLNIEDGDLTMEAGDLHEWTVNLGKGAYANHLNLNSEQSNLYIAHNKDTSESTVTIDTLTLNGGNVMFGRKDGTDINQYSQLNLQHLEGSGNFHMQIDLINKIGDKIAIAKRSSGEHTLHFNDAHSGQYVGDEKLEVVSFDGDAKDNNAQFSGKADLGAYIYNVSKEGENWILGRDGDDPGTNIGKHSAGLLNTNYLLGHVETQTLMQRMGELRNSEKTDNVWGRIYGGKLNSFSNQQLSGFDMDYFGLQIGLDRQFYVNSGKLYLGGVAGYSKGDVDYEIGKGNTKSYHAGLYGTFKHDNGFYIDGLIKYAHMENKINTLTSNDYSVNGKGNSNGLSIGIEVGKRLYLTELNQGWYAEPQAQLTYAHQGSATINSSNGLRTDLNSYNSLLGRGSVAIGYEIKNSENLVNLYFKTGYIKEFDGKTGYSFNGTDHHSFNFDSGWWDNSIGVNVESNSGHQLYAEGNFSKGGSFNKKQLNLGYRFQF